MSFVYLYLENTAQLAIVDEEDFDKVSDFKFYLTKTGSVNATLIHGGKRALANIINGNAKVVYDHKNRVPLDNRKCNLRICSDLQNEWNKGKRKTKSPNKSKYKGVVRRVLKDGSIRWKACIRSIMKDEFLGSFKSEKEAALAYNIAAKEAFGEFAFLNDV